MRVLNYQSWGSKQASSMPVAFCSLKQSALTPAQTFKQLDSGQ